MIQSVKNIVCAAVLAAACVPASAQIVMNVEQCVADALANNARMKNAANDIKASEEAKKSASTKYFPMLSASASDYMADKGLLEMEMGPDMKMSMLKDGIVGGISAQMPLYAGGRIINANRLAETGLEASRLQHSLARNEVALTAETYFWQVVTIKEKLKTLAAVERQLSEFGNDAQAAVDAGVSDRNDLLQVNLKANTVKSQRISLESTLATARLRLAQYTGHSGDSVDVSADMDYTMPPSPLQLYVEPASALASTPEYGLLQQNVKAAKLEYKLTLGQNLPTVAVGGGYMYDNLMDKSHTFWIGFATVSVPISGWWGGSHEMKRSKLAVSNAENKLTDNAQLLTVGMEDKWNRMTDAYRQIGIALESIGQADENLRLHADYYRAGTATMSDLLEAQTLYQDSRAAYAEAYANYEICRRDYLQATGR